MPTGLGTFFRLTEVLSKLFQCQIREITPRKIVNIMQQVLEEIRLNDHDPRRGLITINELDQSNILEEVLGEGGVL